MPSFSSFSKRKESTQIDEQERNNIGSNLDDRNNGKLPRRSTKREFLRNLFKGSGTRSGSNRPSGQFVATTSSAPATPSSPGQLTTPMSDPNKPLPPPPAPGSEPEPAAIPVKKLDRIISPLALPDLHKLFAGAPQFFARSEGHHTGAPHPSVAFPWNLELDIRDLCDHQQIQDHAWSSVSAWPHISRDVGSNPDAVKEQKEKQRAHYLPRCRERPNMLSMQGLERGTMGFQAALEMGVADALHIPEETLADGGADALADRRRKFLRAKDGVRPLTETTLIELLTGASSTYHEDPAKHHRPTVELYTELFTQILFPPSRVTDSEDPYSLPVQIEVLIDVLRSPNIWFDFSLVEWRIKLGQILWGTPPEDEILVNNEVANDLGDQKYWLLLQILLSCELLMRLDAISADIDHGANEPRDSDLNRFDKKTTPSVRWSLILARHWLENIKIEKTKSDAASDEKEPTGWLASFKSPPTAKENEVNGKVHNIQFYGRHQIRQLSGLLHFARKLNWPNLDSIASKIASNGIKIPETTTPAVGTPRSVSTQRSSSYFTRRPSMRRGLSKQRMSAMIHPQGWLSNSYLSGLILPGEGMSHFLISTLLENDETAIARLGEEANLYGGFLYEDKSFWSTACILGRVLTGGKGASECMGWVASDVSPKGSGESWVNIEVELTSHTDGKKDAKPRIWHKSAIERDGNVIGGADSSSVLPGDFIIPSDESTQQPLLIKLESLDLISATDSIHTTPTKETPTPMTNVSEQPRIRSYSASMRFSVDIDGEEKREVNLDLSHDVYFVTAHPCVSSSHMDVLKSPTSPAFNIPGQPGSSGASTGRAQPDSRAHHSLGSYHAGHPLHKAFTFTKLPLSTVLTMPAALPFTSLLSPPHSPTGDATQSTTHTTNSSIPKVLVIDCTDCTMSTFPTHPIQSPHFSAGPKRTYGSDTEILARAMCAERGFNALISRRGRVCLSCSVREASALGWRVVLRVA